MKGCDFYFWLIHKSSQNFGKISQTIGFLQTMLKRTHTKLQGVLQRQNEDCATKTEYFLSTVMFSSTCLSSLFAQMENNVSTNHGCLTPIH